MENASFFVSVNLFQLLNWTISHQVFGVFIQKCKHVFKNLLIFSKIKCDSKIEHHPDGKIRDGCPVGSHSSDLLWNLLDG